MAILNFYFFKQKTAYDVRISDWSSDVCSSDLQPRRYSASHDDAVIEDMRAMRAETYGDDVRTRRWISRRLAWCCCSPACSLWACSSHFRLEGEMIDLTEMQRLINHPDANALGLSIQVRPYDSAHPFVAMICPDGDRKSTRLNPVTNAHLVCRLLLEKKKTF